MAWTTCHHTKGYIDECGQKLVELAPNDPGRDEALDVINNWRSCHSYPLHIVTKTLQQRAANRVSDKALVARRIKRMSSIQLKLRHNPLMKLSQMQDIGGCRVVLSKPIEVEQLVGVYEEAMAKHPKLTDRPFLLKKYDYITSPKADGYRGVHLIMKYQSESKTAFNGQRVEIQLRSQLQHAWATSVETCQAFTGQALKSKVKSASDTWLRFFALMSSAIAARERRPIVPDTPAARKVRKEEIKSLESQEQVIAMLTGWNTAMRHPIVADDPLCVAFLLELNTTEKNLSLTSYHKEHMIEAHAQYLEREKETESDSTVQIVLVSADSVANLKRAYPNFYVDTSAFINAIKQEIY